MRKLVMVCLVVITCIYFNCGIVYAKTVSTEKNIGKNTYYAQLTTSEQPLIKKPIYSSQAYHKKGTTTTIGVEEAKTTSTSASVDVTAGFDFIDKLEVKVGVTQSCSYTVSTSVAYTLKKQQSGKYRIEVWYPGKVENLTLRVKPKGGNKYVKVTTKKSKFTPIKNGQYKKLVKYAN